jgi:hypothetical protein
LYVQTSVRKRISHEKKEHVPTIYRRKCVKILTKKIISPIQDKISLLLLLSKIVLKFINFHTHFAVRLPQQRFLFFFNYSYSVNYLKVRDTISVIIFICTIYLIFFCFILLRFREVFLRFVIIRNIILLPLPVLALRLATNRFMARYRERFPSRAGVLYVDKSRIPCSQWSVPAYFNL